MNKLILTFAAILFPLVMGVISVDQLPNISTDKLQRDPFIEVDEDKNSRMRLQLSKAFYTFRSIQKQKRHAYIKTMKKFDKIVKTLIKFQIIPDEKSLVKSKTKPQYLRNKRSWSFSIIFAIFGQRHELQRVHNELIRLGIQKLSTKPSINFLQEKILSLQVFNSAKSRLNIALQSHHGYQIQQVQKIEIIGMEVMNSDIIQQQIEQEFNYSEQIIEEQNLVNDDQNGNKHDLRMKIIFRVGQSNDDDSGSDVDSDDSDYDRDDSNDDSDYSKDSL